MDRKLFLDKVLAYGKEETGFTGADVIKVASHDTASAVLCSELVNGKDIFTAFKQALGAASANCLSSLCGSFSREDARKLAAGISVEYI